MTETGEYSPSKPSPMKHPITQFNNNVGGVNGPWEPAEGVNVPDTLKPSDPNRMIDLLTGNAPAITTGVFYDNEAKSKFGRPLKLNTVWANKELAQDPGQPIIFFAPGVGTFMGDPDLQARIWHVSDELKAPAFMVDYPNAREAGFLRKKHREGLVKDDVTEVVRSQIRAMRDAGIGGRKIYVVGESMGGFMGLELARELAREAAEDPTRKDLIIPEKLSLVDPAGIREYSSPSAALDALTYAYHFGQTAADNPMYQHKNALSNPHVREIKQYDASMGRQLYMLGKWVAGSLVREVPPMFYFGRVLAHGGLEKKLDEFMTHAPNAEVTLTNFTNSTVCPHDEFLDMVNGKKDENGHRDGGLIARHPGRVRVIYLPGDSHGAMQIHERVVQLNKHAFREEVPPDNARRAEATGRIVGALGNRIESHYNYPEDPTKRLDYHNIQHSSQVRQAGRKILETVLDLRNTSASERERLLALTDIAAYGHDVVQDFSFAESEDYGVTIKLRRSKTGTNEQNSADATVRLMRAENKRAGHDVFTDDDIAIVRDAIGATVPEIAPAHIGQPNLTDKSSEVAIAVAVADLYNPYMYANGDVVKNTFREHNADILERLHADKKILDPAVRGSVVKRMDAWLANQRLLIPDMRASLGERLAALSESERRAVERLMKFDEVARILTAFAKKHEAYKSSFTELLNLWGYYDIPDRYTVQPKKANAVHEIAG